MIQYSEGTKENSVNSHPGPLKEKKVTQVSSPKESTINSFYVYIRIIPETVYAHTHIYPHMYKSTYIHIACT